MDAPFLPSAFYCFGLTGLIAAIHPAFACDSWSLALMEYAG
jgi:hypothetical protein